jgi:hypothetical protein
MQSFMNATAETIAAKYEDDDIESPPTNGFADSDDCQDEE